MESYQDFGSMSEKEKKHRFNKRVKTPAHSLEQQKYHRKMALIRKLKPRKKINP